MPDVILSRLLMVPKDKVGDAMRDSRGQPWPGDERVGPNDKVICRGVKLVEEREKHSILELIYEG